MNELQFLKTLNTLITKRINEIENVRNNSKSIKELFFDLYKKKAMEITNREVKVPWGAKEGKLFQTDFLQFGEKEMKRMILIFFSDKDYSIAEFTRYKNKAGYGYGVFHGLIGKLQLSTVKIKEPCKYCGRIDGHDYNCKIEVEKREARQKEIDEINKQKEQLKDKEVLIPFDKRFHMA